MEKLGLYIHIPFCIRKCYYCDFNSYANLNHVQEEYVECLIREMTLYRKQWGNLDIGSIYIGGGTPTCLEKKLINKLLDACCNIFKISNNCEISIESNPGTLSKDKLKVLKMCGINRLSIGLQSWQNEHLRSLGRIHTRDQFIENFYTAREVGFNNINIDLMFGLPSQTIQQWEETLQNIITLYPEHISCYSLIIEENTKLYTDYQKDQLKIPDENTEREMYYKTIRMLTQAGYEHYEISNFSQKDLECRHNLVYWTCKEYIGLGAGAHSHMNNIRYSNIVSPTEYIKQIQKDILPNIEKMPLKEEDRMSEFIILGLRLMKGVNPQEFYDIFKVKIESVFGREIKKFMELRLIEYKEGNYRLTARGIDISNQIFMEFI